VLAAFPGRPVVQLPQSIHFGEQANLERFRRLVGSQGCTTVLCRDEASLALARRWFDAEVAYCPDLALALGPQARPAPAVVDVLWLARTDPERRHAPPAPAPDVEVVDWLHPLPGEPPWPPRRRLAFELDQRLLGGAPEPARPQRGLTARVAAATFGPLARGWVERGLSILARGRVVVTDRLHGHLLAFLAGIPSVVLDNSYGKVHGVVALTTAGSPRTHLAGSTDEALALARDLARELR
jgi:exopolysaccharide biosynthesis predicted pyruvyltransferase EpsI